jgi:O-antigen ligase
MRLGPSQRLLIPRPTAWRCFTLLLVAALGAEYWNKDALRVGPVLVPWPFFVLILILLPLVVPPSARRWSELLRLPRPLGPMLFFWACCAMSIVAVALAPASQPIQYVRTLAHLTMYVVFVAAIVKWITWPRLWLLVRAYYVLGILAALLSVVQMLHGGFGLFPWLAALRFQSAEHMMSADLTTGFRSSSFFGEPSWAARYFVHFIAVALAFFIRTRERRHLAAAALFLVAFYGANSLLGYAILATFVASAALAQAWRSNLFTLGQAQKILIGVLVYLTLIGWLVGVTPEPPDLLDRSITRIGLVLQGGGGAGNRIDSVFAGLEVWKQAPVLGIGLGNIENYIVPFYQDPAWTLRSQYASDSLYVQLLAEAGLPGLIGFLWFWGRLLWFPAPDPAVLRARPDVAWAFTLIRFLQLDLFAQAVGMLNASDYLNPHLWTVVAIVLACKTFIIRETGVTGRAEASEPAAPPLVLHRLPM